MRFSGIARTGMGWMAVWCFASAASAAGTLESFEGAISTPPTASSTTQTGGQAEGGKNGFGLFLNLVFGIFADSDAAEYAEPTSFFEEAGVSQTGPVLARRERGDPQLANVRLDIGYQNLQSDVRAIDGGIEIGSGHYALHYRSTHFYETRSDDVLRMQQTHFLWRATTQPGVEADFGIGYLSIEASRHSSGISLTVPIRWKINNWSAVEMRAAWAEVNGHGVSDYDLSFGFLRPFAGLRLGYRYIDARGVPPLQGPYIGLSLYY
ncbi:MAG: hypothetical protein ACKVP2_10730 [Burkholderiales bacterium]